MSEKLDGVRAYWDGKQLISRLGNELHAPDWFVKGLPKSPLDGELWLERKAFQKTVSIVRRQDKSDHWKQIRYVVFDAPDLKEPFEQRLKFVADALAAVKSDFVVPHEHRECRSVDHLQTELARVESLGGEGLMLRQPGSQYEAGRSTTLLKVKTFHDADGVVVAHVPGKGRHKGRVGALVVHMSDGTEFSVGTGLSDKERENPPAIGSTDYISISGARRPGACHGCHSCGCGSIPESTYAAAQLHRCSAHPTQARIIRVGTGPICRRTGFHREQE